MSEPIVCTVEVESCGGNCKPPSAQKTLITPQDAKRISDERAVLLKKSKEEFIVGIKKTVEETASNTDKRTTGITVFREAFIFPYREEIVEFLRVEGWTVASCKAEEFWSISVSW